jgi:hypothetical protein
VPLPVGSLLRSCQNLGGIIEFYDVKERRTLAATEHMQATVVSYDPSGRFVITAKTQPMVPSNMVAARDTVRGLGADPVRRGVWGGRWAVGELRSAGN